MHCLERVLSLHMRRPVLTRLCRYQVNRHRVEKEIGQPSKVTGTKIVFQVYSPASARCNVA